MKEVRIMVVVDVVVDVMKVIKEQVVSIHQTIK